MASRFTLERLAHYHSTFTQHRYAARDGEEALNENEASAKLEAWAGGALLPEQLVNPKVVLLVASFPPTVTATAVWLNERGVDLTLMSYHAYRIGSGEIVLTVSQLYPLRDVAHFEVAPKTEGGSGVASPAYPEVPWTPADMATFAEVVANNPVALAITDLCALSPGLGLVALKPSSEPAWNPAAGVGSWAGSRSRSRPASRGPTRPTKHSGPRVVVLELLPAGPRTRFCMEGDAGRGHRPPARGPRC